DVVVTVYVDTLFALNGMVNYLLLLAAVRITDRPFRRWRLLLGAVLGGLYAVAVFVPPLGGLAGPPGKAAAGLLMALVAAGGRPWGRFWRYILVFLGASFALGGCVLALGVLTGRDAPPGGVPVLPVSLPILLAGAGVCYLIFALVFRRSARHGGAARDIVTVRLDWGGRTAEVAALWDTGNTLSDPLTGAPVMVMDCERGRALLPAEAALLVDKTALRRPERVLTLLHELGLAGRFRLIPYRAVGVECGFLLAFRPDVVTVGGRRRPGVLVALAPHALGDGVGYSAVV
ncbi:MAG: sigma-E processing peptidase SpoIIGA, partial [Oscillospiraceae bacterium]|nr:sigma-E processing peptidase SpoIIGA [Oscillospiraceae bacterium]